MTWSNSLKKFRGRETGHAGVFRRICRNWIYQKFRDNEEERSTLFLNFNDNKLTLDKFKEVMQLFGLVDV